MKKRTLFSLIVLVILCLVVAVVAFVSERNATRKLEEAQSQITLLDREMDLLRREKIAWDEDKARVSKSLVDVRTVLGGMLSGLEEASQALDAASSLLPTPKASLSPSPAPTNAPTKAPAASPTAVTTKAVDKPSATPFANPSPSAEPSPTKAK